MLVGVKVIAGASPKPVNITICGLPVAPLVMTSAPLRVPLEVGANRISTVHDAPTERVAEQVVGPVKSPKAMMLEMFKSPLPLLEIFTVVAVLVDPTSWSLKVMTVADKVSEPTPSPDRVTDNVTRIAGDHELTGTRSSSIRRESNADCATLAARVPLLVWQVFVCENSPLTVTLLTTSVADPVFVSVMSLGALTVPAACDAKVRLLADVLDVVAAANS